MKGLDLGIGSWGGLGWRGSSVGIQEDPWTGVFLPCRKVADFVGGHLDGDMKGKADIPMESLNDWGIEGLSRVLRVFLCYWKRML